MSNGSCAIHSGWWVTVDAKYEADTLWLMSETRTAIRSGWWVTVNAEYETKWIMVDAQYALVHEWWVSSDWLVMVGAKYEPETLWMMIGAKYEADTLWLMSETRNAIRSGDE